MHMTKLANHRIGGHRESGMGRLRGPEGLVDFMESKHIYAEFVRIIAP